MNQFTFVQNKGAAFRDSGTSDLISLANGATDKTVQLVDLSTGQTIDTSTGSVTDYNEVQLVFADSSTEAKIFTSIPLDTSSLEVVETPYSAPQPQKTDIELPDGPTGGGTFGIKVVNEESGQQPYEYRYFEVEVEDGEAAGDIVDKFVNLIESQADGINGYQGSSVTASKDTTELELTAKENGDIFSVAYQGFDPVNVDLAQTPSLGQGTYEYVKRAEEVNRASSGRYAQQSQLLGTQPEFPTYADPNNQYDLLTFTVDGDYEKAINKSNQKIQYVVALKTGLSGGWFA